MKREYESQDVYEAFQSRLHLIFREFDNIYISFSGGKDSGLLLNMALDFQQKYYPEKQIGVFHQDFEAQYTVTTEYIDRTFKSLEGKAERYWVWRMSSVLGRALPEGWLCTSITAADFFSNALLTIAFLSITVESWPPLLIFSFEMSLLDLLRNSIQHSSWSRFFMCGSIVLKTFSCVSLYFHSCYFL